MGLFFKVILCIACCATAFAQDAQNAYLSNSGFGELLSAPNAPVTVWWCASGWKVAPGRALPTAHGDAIRLAAAANEIEAAQVVLHAIQPLSGLTWAASELRTDSGEILPESSIEILRVACVNVQTQTDTAGNPGLWPDPLPPITAPLEVPANVNQAFWIRVTVPATATAGTYTGELTMSCTGGQAAFSIEVRVFGFALPDTMTCTSAFGFDPGLVFRYHGLQNEADQRTVLAKYWESFSRHHISPYSPAPLDKFKETWPENAASLDPEALKPMIDWSAFDREMEKAFAQYHFNSFILPTTGLGGGTFHSRVEPELLGFAESTPQYQAAFKHYWDAVEEHLRGKGWLDKSYMYWFDEPDPKDYDFVNNGFRKLREAAPDIPRMLTEQPEPGLLGGPNIWCPISDQFNVDRACVRMTQGEKFWWYVCTGPKAPYAGEFIDHPATELRVWLWQTWQRGINGILIWQSNYWHSPEAYPDAPQNPYEDPMSWTTSYSTQKGQKLPWGNGDGRFLYPPLAAANGQPPAPVLDGPVDSIRWEMLRDGLEDYEYMVILERLLEKEQTSLDQSQAVEYRKLLQVPADITTNMTTFTADPAQIEQHREKVAAAIESLAARS